MEAETIKLRMMQEKHADEQAIEDQRRARRYQDQMERKERDEVTGKESRRKQGLVELKRDREAQSRIKERAKAEEAIVQRAAYLRVLSEQKELHERELIIEERKVYARKAHALEIRQQIVRNEEEKVLKRAEFLEEGKYIKQRQRVYHDKLERIRQKKIAELVKAKVPDKYLAELRSMKIEDH